MIRRPPRSTLFPTRRSSDLNVQVFPTNLPTMRVHHYSLDAQYDLGHDFVATLGYQGSLSRDIFFHENPNAVPAASGFALNPQIDRKSTRLNSSHSQISYAVFCLKKKK